MDELSRAVEVLRAGGLVAFPTETVYGLGADATNARALRKIFQAKGRPATNPLIVHVAEAAVARRYAAAWPDSAEKLSRRFWPGPLTLVLPKHPTIVDEATAGRPTLGLRAPDHPLALELLRRFGGPVAAPSANRSTRVSPTTAQHVREELGAAVDMVLDGGPCRVGIESTVLDLSQDRPTILRPGFVTAEDIAAEIGQAVAVFKGQVHPTIAAASPGQHAIHYAPRAPAYRFEAPHWPEVLEWCRRHAGQPWAVMTVGAANAAVRQALGAGLIEMPASAGPYARCLYATLRQLDARGVETIWIQMPTDAPHWAAVRDRIMRATKEKASESANRRTDESADA